ncbi:hypothetical protein Daus18300_011456 [Diaporthe australafricana]|uniref:Uncharacterized protein n=1 Tax=Diaporthe australafricana TaxID=127596 RepID=A0ABR3W6V5_9PEZI
MEPLSISLSVLAVMGAAGFVVKTVKAIESAPHKLIDISNAAKALETTLENKLSQGLIFHIQRSEEKLLSLTRYIDDHGLTSPNKLRSPIYYVRYQEKLRKYKRQLSDVRDDLALALSAVTYGQAGRIEVDLQQLVLSRQVTRQGLAEQKSQLDFLAQKTEEMGLAQAQMANLLESIKSRCSERQPKRM